VLRVDLEAQQAMWPQGCYQVERHIAGSTLRTGTVPGQGLSFVWCRPGDEERDWLVEASHLAYSVARTADPQRPGRRGPKNRPVTRSSNYIGLSRDTAAGAAAAASIPDLSPNLDILVSGWICRVHDLHSPRMTIFYCTADTFFAPDEAY
jgi:hypothetical protein